MAELAPGGPAGITLENLVQAPGDPCYAPGDPARPGLLTLAVRSPEVMGAVSVRFFPRINAESPVSALTLSWSADGERFTPLYRLAGDGKGGWTPAWEIREERGASPGAKTIYFRFELTGKAQLWLDETRPLRFWIVPGGAPLLGNAPDVG